MSYGTSPTSVSEATFAWSTFLHRSPSLGTAGIAVRYAVSGRSNGKSSPSQRTNKGDVTVEIRRNRKSSCRYGKRLEVQLDSLALPCCPPFLKQLLDSKGRLSSNLISSTEKRSELPARCCGCSVGDGQRAVMVKAAEQARRRAVTSQATTTSRRRFPCQAAYNAQEVRLTAATGMTAVLHSSYLHPHRPPPHPQAVPHPKLLEPPLRYHRAVGSLRTEHLLPSQIHSHFRFLRVPPLYRRREAGRWRLSLVTLRSTGRDYAKKGMTT